MTTFVGALFIETAEKVDEGYRLTLTNGDVITVTDETFESQFFPIEEGTKITPTDVQEFTTDVQSERWENTTIVKLLTKTGLQCVGSSSCVNASTYDHEIGTKLAKEKAEETIWSGLGFVLKWAMCGLKQGQK